MARYSIFCLGTLVFSALLTGCTGTSQSSEANDSKNHSANSPQAPAENATSSHAGDNNNTTTTHNSGFTDTSTTPHDNHDSTNNNSSNNTNNQPNSLKTVIQNSDSINALDVYSPPSFDSEAAAKSSTINVRLAFFSNTTEPLDFCARTNDNHVSSLLEDTALNGISSSTVSQYVHLPANTTEIIVAKPNTDCSVVTQTIVAPAEIESEETFYTVVVGESSGSQVSPVFILNDLPAPTTGHRFRTVMVSPFENLDVFTYEGWRQSDVVSSGPEIVNGNVSWLHHTAEMTDPSSSLEYESGGYAYSAWPIAEAHAVEFRSTDTITGSWTTVVEKQSSPQKEATATTLFVARTQDNNPSFTLCRDDSRDEPLGLTTCYQLPSFSGDNAPGSYIEGAIPAESAGIQPLNTLTSVSAVDVCLKPHRGKWLSTQTQKHYPDLHAFTLVSGLSVSAGDYSVRFIQQGGSCDSEQNVLAESVVSVEAGQHMKATLQYNSQSPGYTVAISESALAQ